MSAWLAPLITGILSTLVTALYLRQRYLRGLALQIERLKNQLSLSEQQLANSQTSEGELRDQLLRFKEAGINLDMASEASTGRVFETRINIVKGAKSNSASIDPTLDDKLPSSSTDQQGLVERRFNEPPSQSYSKFSDKPTTASEQPTLVSAKPAEDSSNHASDFDAPRQAAKPSSAKTRKSKAASTKTKAWFDTKEARRIMGKPVKPDDLKLIEGVGPKIAELFEAQGVLSWQTLSNLGVEGCQQILDNGGGRFAVHNPSTWPEQAALAAKADWTALRELQTQLKEG